MDMKIYQKIKSRILKWYQIRLIEKGGGFDWQPRHKVPHSKVAISAYLDMGVLKQKHVVDPDGKFTVYYKFSRNQLLAAP
jgi:hypothetical protein